MNNARFLTAGLLLGALTVTSFAQETRPIGLSIRGGLFLPVNSKGRDEGNTWFGGGVDYRLANVRMGNMGTTTTAHWSISFDFYNKGDLSAAPLLANYVAHQNEFFYSVGAGVAFSKDFDVVAGARTKKNSTQFAYQLGFGYEFQKGNTPLFAEAKFFGNGITALNGMGVYIGIRL